MASAQIEPRPSIGFVYLGGIHQALHSAPVALALARRGAAVSAYVAPEYAAALGTMLGELDPEAAARVAIVPLVLPGWLDRVARRTGATKPAMLLAWRRRLAAHDALIAVERTSTLLKRLPGRRPRLIYSPHGSGDRAVGVEPRIRLFDHLLVSGPVRAQRFVDEGVTTHDRISVVGAIKLSALLAAPAPPRPFADGRPVVLYNPHFDAALSSWPIARAIVDAILADGRFYLIVAPHARLAERLASDERAAFEALGARADCHVDFASPALSDMTYTRSADIYLGDVSSQVYEFLHRPRPVVFVDAHHVAWQGDPSYRMWNMGDVVSEAGAVTSALGGAAARHAHYRATQVDYVAGALGAIGPQVPDVAADSVLSFVVSRP